MSSSSYSSRSAGGRKTSGQQSTSQSSSTSTTPPQTPTIRVTSPVPDAVRVVDIWDPELDEVDISATEKQAADPEPVKAYSFRYKEEAKVPDEGIASLADIAGPIKMADESDEEEEEEEEVSQVSAVTQVPLSGPSPEEEEVEDEVEVLPDHPAFQPSGNGSKPVKRVQFSRSLSLVPALSTGLTKIISPGAEHHTGAGGRLVGSGRRYSSLDGVTGLARGMTPLVMDFHPASAAAAAASGGVSSSSAMAMLSPTPESALESAQSPDNSSSGSVPQDPPQGDGGGGGAGSSSADEQTAAPSTAGSKLKPDIFERLAVLKEDEELMGVAQDFVTRLLIKAQEEAMRRGAGGQQAGGHHHHHRSRSEQKSKLSLDLQHVAVPKLSGSRSTRKWYRRMRSILLRTLTCTCIPAHPNIQSPL